MGSTICSALSKPPAPGVEETGGSLEDPTMRQSFGDEFLLRRRGNAPPVPACRSIHAGEPLGATGRRSVDDLREEHGVGGDWEVVIVIVQVLWSSKLVDRAMRWS